MNTHSPDERLSAFYDGELSAAERADVERLVTERPDLREELSMLAGLSQRLCDLADDLPEVDLRSRVMQRMAAAPPVSPRAVVATGVAEVWPPRRRWMPLLLTVCALTLLVAAVLPLLPLTDQADLVAISENPPAENLGMMGGDPVISSGSRMGSPLLHTPLAGGGFATHDTPMTVSLAPAEVAENSTSAAPGLGAEGTNTDGTGPSEFLASIERVRDLKPGDIVSRLVEGGDVPMIADYTVVDVDRTANHVEILLQEHGIVPLNPTAETEQRNAKARPTKAKTLSNIKVYLVDAESVSLNTALVQCQNLKEVVGLNVEPIMPYEADDETQLVAKNATLNPAAGAASPAALAPAKLSATSKAGADRRAGADALGDAREGVAAKGKPLHRQPQPGEPQADVSDSVNLADKNMADQSLGRSKLTSLINGNSLVVEHGDELYTEIKQHQLQLPKNSVRGNYALKQQQSVDHQPFTQPGQKTESVESTLRKGQSLPAPSNLQADGLQYNFTGRYRQRAILVLRPQSPPPPPESTNIDP